VASEGHTDFVPARPLVLIVFCGGPRGGVVQWHNLDPEVDLPVDGAAGRYRRSDPIRFQLTEFGTALALDYFGAP